MRTVVATGRTRRQWRKSTTSFLASANSMRCAFRSISSFMLSPVVMVVPAIVVSERCCWEEVMLVTSVCCNLHCSVISNTIFLQGAHSASYNHPPGPLPDSYFISSNQPLPRPQAASTATKEGKAATKKRKAPQEGKATQPRAKSTRKNKKDA